MSTCARLEQVFGVGWCSFAGCAWCLDRGNWRDAGRPCREGQEAGWGTGVAVVELEVPGE
jgi:hypothetical protein